MGAQMVQRAGLRGLAAGLVAVVLLACMSGPVLAAAMADPVWVRFPSARAQPSPLALRAFGGAGEAARRRPAAEVHGLLLTPVGAGPYPAVVLMHDCRGVRGNHRSWANWFASAGYVTLLVDSYFGRNAIKVCERGPDRFADQAVGGRIFDAFGAAQYLARDPRVDASRIAVVSWGHALAISATAAHGAQQLVTTRFRAGVAIGADCPLEGDRRSAPLLLVAPERNGWSRPGRCASFARRASREPEVRAEILPGAFYGFDDPEEGAAAPLQTAYNPWTSPDRGVEMRYDLDAHRRSVQAVAAFLHQHLALDGLAAFRALDRGYPGGAWVVDPNRPGPDRPPAGASLFDALLLHWREQGHAGVPYPLSRLVQLLRPLAGVDETGRSGLKATFVPLGRSLQRHAAAPQFFRYPRVLLTIDGEAPAAAGGTRAFLKDQLFIGYQERAATLEVISFNPILGRFEFQVVEDYDGEGRARVRYANRTLCVSCHHNQAPVFPRAAWDETHDNTALEQRLHAARPDLYGLQRELDATPAARFDNATDRASDLLLWQHLWQHACGDHLRCRGELVKAALQYRLSSSNSFERDAATYREAVVMTLADALQHRHGDALQLASADLPNRDPMLSSHPTRLEALMDPLTPRPVQRLSSRDARELAMRWVHGTAERFPLADARAIDAALQAQEGASSRRIAVACALQQRGRPRQASQVTLRCGPAQRPLLSMALSVSRQVLQRGQVGALRLRDEPTQERLRVSTMPGSGPIAPGQEVALEFRHGLTGLSVRLGNGERVQGVRWRWPREDDVTRRTPLARFYAAEAELVLVDDTQPLLTALTSLLEDPSGALAGATLRPAQVLAPLRQRLGTPLRSSICCEAVAPIAPASAASRDEVVASAAPASPAASPLGSVQRFRLACGACHAGATLAPPGFLAGNDAQALSALRQCAERIFLRLSMWQLAPEERMRSPMPPASVVRPLDLAELRDLAAGWYGERHHRAPSLEALTARGYDDAAACLPSAALRR
jgi:dienelactone hydrolase